MAVSRGKRLFRRETDSGNKKAGKMLLARATRVIIKLIATSGEWN